jgi:4-amino-4-deoxy-L-arabinose transferase-like glycosyltransferase
VLVNATLISESIGLPLMLGALALALAGRRAAHPLRWAGAAGVVTGLAILDRPALGVLVVPLALAFWGRPWRRPRAALAPALALLLAGLTVAPWTVRNAVEMHAFVPVSTQSGYLLAGTYNDAVRNDPVYPGLYRPATADPKLAQLVRASKIDEVETARRLRQAARDYMRDHPRYVAQVVGWSSTRITQLSGGADYGRFALSFQGIGSGLADAATYAWYAAALLAIAGLALVRRGVGPLWFWLTPLLLLATVVVISGDTRYRLPIEPFAVLLAAAAIARGYDGVRRRSAAPR